MKKLCLLFLLLSFQSFSKSVNKLYEEISFKTGVPSEVLKGVCSHESQSFWKGNRQAWPYAINFKGRGFYYKTKSDAYGALLTITSRGYINVDVGLCQVNWKYHNHRFQSLYTALDPRENLKAAAEFLSELKQERPNSSWKEVVGRYHSPNNEERAKWYSEKVFSNI